jgi:tRNA(fMet)-specific endonuclease VapC
MLDTSTCIDLIRGRSPRILARLRRYAVGTILISAITLAELEHGVEKSSNPARNRLALAKFCAALEIIAFDSAAAAAYGAIRAQLEREGHVIGPMDLLIAAHARSLDLTIVTSNEREFARVQDLVVQNWR